MHYNAEIYTAWRGVISNVIIYTNTVQKNKY